MYNFISNASKAHQNPIIGSRNIDDSKQIQYRVTPIILKIV